MAAELGAHRRTVRRLLDQHGIRRARRTQREQAAGGRDRRAQSGAWQARRGERLAELGFVDLAAYLQCRFVQEGCSVRRMRRSFGLVAAGWPLSWRGWAFGIDVRHDRGMPGTRRGQ